MPRGKRKPTSPTTKSPKNLDGQKSSSEAQKSSSEAQKSSSDAQKSSFAGPMKPAVPISLAAPPAQPCSIESKKTNIRRHPFWNQVQVLTDDLLVFLSHEYQISNPKIKKAQIYRILLHFNPKTPHRVTHHKDILLDAFETELLLHLGPFISSPPPTPMETDLNNFDPLTAPRRLLKEAIKCKKPSFTIPEGPNSHSLHLLYKEHIDKDLVVPAAKAFSCRPRYTDAAGLKSKTIEYLRFSLQCHAPQVFIHFTPMTRPVCLDLYIRFILELEVAPGRLIEGYHYTIIPPE